MTLLPSISLEEIKRIASKFLELSEADKQMIDVALATYLANRFDADPIWVFINGPPANAKTEILRAMNGHPKVHFISSLTKNTFISGKTVKNNKTGEQIDCSLLPKLNGKLVVIKDFTSVLTLQKDARGEIYSQLREIHDGKYDKPFGTGEVKRWEGKFGILSGVTPAIDKQLAIQSLLGERFLHYRVTGSNRIQTAKKAMKFSTGIKAHREELRVAVTKFMTEFDGLRIANLQDIQDDIADKIAALSVFCATARTSVMRNKYDQTLQTLPEPEGPARLAKQFSVIAIALALVREQPVVDEAIYQVVRKIATDSMHKLRFTVLKALWKLYQENQRWYTTTEVASQAKIPPTTAKLKLENLMLLGLVERDREGTGDKSPYTWAPGSEWESMEAVAHFM